MEGRNSENSLPIGRLPSLRAPRDLTLGGNGRGLRGDPQRRGVKRTFTPNIPAPKIKKEQIEGPTEAGVAHSSATPHGKRTTDRGDRGRGRGSRGRGQGRGQNIVYQKSIFEEWSNEKPKPREGSYCGFGGGGGGGGGGSRESFGSRGASSEASSIIKVKEEAMDDSNTDDIMKDLLHDNTDHKSNCIGYDEFLADNSLATVDPAMFPVLIELESKTEPKSEQTDAKPSVDASSQPNDVKVKEEHKNVIDAPEVKTLKPKISIPWTRLHQPPEMSFLSPVNDDKKLLLIHFPDVLPGFPSNAPTVSASKSNVQTVTDAESTSHSLSDFAEGFIGKMKVRRSGKVELELSNVVFEGSALPSKILQEVVVCEFERNALQRPVSGDMTLIGHIGHKINFTPKIDAIVDSIS